MISDARPFNPRDRLPAPGVTIVAALAVALALFFVFGGSILPETTGPPVEDIAVERTVLRHGWIDVTVRNTGPHQVQIAQVFVNDAYVDIEGGSRPIGRLRSATLRLSYPWQVGQPYLVSMLSSSGMVFEHRIPSAVVTPTGAGAAGSMTLLGTYVGVIPVALGLTTLPLLRRLGPAVVRWLLTVTVGLLAFLAIDGGVEAVALAGRSGGAFGGPALVVMGAGLAFGILAAVDSALQNRRDHDRRPLALSLAVGIGLHNLGEGLAVGSAYAVGELALGAFFVIGFALHNITEGIAIAVTMEGHRASLVRLAGLALLAGLPAIAGAVLGGTVAGPELSPLLLGAGVGAIAQVILQIIPSLRGAAGRGLDGETVAGIAAGAFIMYVTGLLVS